MQLMLQTPIGTEGDADDRSRITWSYVVRLGLAMAALAAAYFLVTTASPAELAGEVLGSVETGSVPHGITQAFRLAADLR